jgi:ECF sigma factor
MSGVANSELQIPERARSSLDARALARLAHPLEQELRRYLCDNPPVAGRKSPLNLAALRVILGRLFEAEATPEELRRYLLFAAPLVRRVMLACAASANRPPSAAPSLQQIELWLRRLEAFDPLAVLMIELHHFCGLSVRETAGVLSVSLETVMCDLRFARAWLHAIAKRP